MATSSDKTEGTESEEPGVEVTTETMPEPKLERSDFMTLIANALKVGTISAEQAKQMRQELGVFQGDFAKKKDSAKLKKQKRKAQKKARAVTRQQGFKGQKVTKGRATGRGR